MMQNDEIQYWVVGGDYSDFNFVRIIEGTLLISGPYADRATALQAWRKQSQENRYKATTRFTIASSPAPSVAALRQTA